jgi:hypothetical protein
MAEGEIGRMRWAVEDQLSGRAGARPKVFVEVRNTRRWRMRLDGDTAVAEREGDRGPGPLTLHRRRKWLMNRPLLRWDMGEEPQKMRWWCNATLFNIYARLRLAFRAWRMQPALIPFKKLVAHRLPARSLRTSRGQLHHHQNSTLSQQHPSLLIQNATTFTPC